MSTPTHAATTLRLGKKRRLAARVLLALAVIAAMLLAASSCTLLHIEHNAWAASICRGKLSTFDKLSGSGNLATVLDPAARGMEWWLGWGRPSAANPSLSVDKSYGLFGTYQWGGWGGVSRSREFILWPVPVLLCAAALLVLHSSCRARRQAAANVCINCGYPLTGLASTASCPECGTTRAT